MLDRRLENFYRWSQRMQYACSASSGSQKSATEASSLRRCTKGALPPLICMLMMLDGMSAQLTRSRTVILIKALPQPSKKFGETVCCAGVTANREWKRLYPVRFRYLQSDQRFRRWQWLEFDHRRPTSDTRIESCHVYEDRIFSGGELAEKDRFALLAPMILPSAKAAAAQGASLALIRPSNTKFVWKVKSPTALDAERSAYKSASSQRDILDTELAAFEPSPYQFAFTFSDAAGAHTWRCGDWETHATFFKLRNQYSEREALQHLDRVYNEEYPRRGMVFAVGNMAKRPQTWQLLGVIRLAESGQLRLF